MRDSDIKKWKNIIEHELKPALDEGLTMSQACKRIGYTNKRVYDVIKTLGLRIEYVDMEGNPTNGNRLTTLVPLPSRAGKRTFKEVQVRKIRLV